MMATHAAAMINPVAFFRIIPDLCNDDEPDASE
jgi:hypothetical protein